MEGRQNDYIFLLFVSRVVHCQLAPCLLAKKVSLEFGTGVDSGSTYDVTRQIFLVARLPTLLSQ